MNDEQIEALLIPRKRRRISLSKKIATETKQDDKRESWPNMRTIRSRRKRINKTRKTVSPTRVDIKKSSKRKKTIRHSINNSDIITQSKQDIDKYFAAIEKPKKFNYVQDNIYKIAKSKRPTVAQDYCVTCDCIVACAFNCINRKLLMECSFDCKFGDKCANQRFRRKQYTDMVCFTTSDGRGIGVKTLCDLNEGDFIIEYCGEVIDRKEFEKRSSNHGKDFYGMCITNEVIIDATKKGNLARFINHCCDPNCTTAVWTVQGNLRVGIFAAKTIAKHTELTYDYQFEMYGKCKRQRCHCGAENCTGFIGKKK